MTTDAAPPPPMTFAELEKRLGKEATEAIVAWFGEGHTDKLSSFLRRFVCGIGTIVSDAPLREGAAVLGRAIDALESWSLSDQQKHIEMLATQAKAMIGKDLSEDFAKQVIAWSEKRAAAKGTTTAEWCEKGANMAFAAGGLAGPFAPRVGQAGQAAAARTWGVVKEVEIEEVTFTAFVDGKRIEHSYTSDEDLHLVLACPTPTGEILKVWGRDPEPGPLAAGAPGPEPVFSQVGFLIVVEGRRCLLGFSQEDSIVGFLSERRPLGVILNDFISRLTNPSPIGDPDVFEITEPPLEDDKSAGEGTVTL